MGKICLLSCIFLLFSIPVKDFPIKFSIGSPGDTKSDEPITQTPSVLTEITGAAAAHENSTSVQRPAPAVQTSRISVPSSNAALQQPIEPETTAYVKNRTYAEPVKALVQKPKQAPEKPEPKPKFVNFDAAGTTKRTRKQHEADFGLEAGLNLNGLRNNQTKNTMTTGFHFGAITNIKLSDHFALQAELQFIKKGNEINTVIKEYTGNVSSTTDIIMDYVELPINLVYKFGRPGSGRFVMGGGGYMAYMVYYNNGVAPASNDANPFAAPVPTLDTRKYDCGADAFVGCEMPRGFFAKGGAQIGFINIEQTTNGFYNNKNYNFTLTVGQYLGR